MENKNIEHKMKAVKTTIQYKGIEGNSEGSFTIIIPYKIASILMTAAMSWEDQWEFSMKELKEFQKSFIELTSTTK